MSSVAIITARGGSKRIPRKNIRDFCGKPIIAYSIEVALESGIFDEVMVSTDDEEIADISRKYGAEVPFMRSDRTSNDYTGTDEVLIEVIEEYKKKGYWFDEFCCIYPTAPFITCEKLQHSHKLLQKDGVYNVVPMVAFSFPPQRGMIKKDNGMMEPVSIEGVNSRSQDLPIIYHDCGQFYWCKTKEFLNNTNILYNNTLPYIVSELEVQDIDNESDWKLAEIKYSYMKSK